MTSTAENVAEVFQCLDMIEDEVELRPGVMTIDGRDGATIDLEKIQRVVNVARAELIEIDKALR